MPEIRVKDGLGCPLTFVEFNGKIVPNFPGIEQNLAEITDMPGRGDDVVILSYPKAGANWSWKVINMLYAGDGKLSSRDKLKSESMLEFATQDQINALLSVRLLNTHVFPEFYPKDLISKKCKIIFVQRNPKDVYVSYYHFCRKIKTYDYEGEWKGFFELMMEGKVEYGTWFDFTKQWEEFFTQHHDLPLLRLYFEDMKTDLPSEIEKMSLFLDLPCSTSYREKVAEKCGIDVMKKEKKLPKEIMDVYVKGSDNPMCRKGIIGDWKTHFTVAQNERFDAEYKKQMSGFTFKFEQYM